MALASHETAYDLLQDSVGADDDSSGHEDEHLRRFGESKIQDGLSIVEDEVEAKQYHELKRNDQENDEVRVDLYPFLL